MFLFYVFLKRGFGFGSELTSLFWDDSARAVVFLKGLSWEPRHRQLLVGSSFVLWGQDLGTILFLGGLVFGLWNVEAFLLGLSLESS